MFEKIVSEIKKILEDNLKLPERDKEKKFSTSQSFFLSELPKKLEDIDQLVFNKENTLSFIALSNLIEKAKATLASLEETKITENNLDNKILIAPVNSRTEETSLEVAALITSISSTLEKLAMYMGPTQDISFLYNKALIKTSYAIFILTSNFSQLLNKAQKIKIIKSFFANSDEQESINTNVFKGIFIELANGHISEIKNQIEKYNYISPGNIALLSDILITAKMAHSTSFIDLENLDALLETPHLSAKTKKTILLLHPQYFIHSIHTKKPCGSDNLYAKVFSEMKTEKQVSILQNYAKLNEDSSEILFDILDQDNVLEKPEILHVLFTTPLHFYLDADKKTKLLLSLTKHPDILDSIKSNKSLDWLNLFAHWHAHYSADGDNFIFLMQIQNDIKVNEGAEINTFFYEESPWTRVEIAMKCGNLQLSVEQLTSSKLNEAYQTELAKAEQLPAVVSKKLGNSIFTAPLNTTYRTIEIKQIRQFLSDKLNLWQEKKQERDLPPVNRVLNFD